MEKNNIAVSVSHLVKSYPLYKKPIDRLKESLSIICHKSYHKDFLAVNDITFEVKKGECFGIIGVNGSGKSTTLKMITDVLKPTSGKIEINGKVSALLELGAGFNMDYTGIENIYLNGMVLGYTKEEIKKLIPEIEKFADIGDFINQPVKTYSSGMFARLAFAVAINIDPDILIVDEALSVGDVFFQAKCYHKFEEFKKQGKTIIFVTHDITSVLKYCDRVMLLDKGKTIKIGDPHEVTNIFKKILANTFEEETEEPKVEEKKQEEETISWSSRLAINSNPQVYGNGVAEIIDFGVFNSDGDVVNAVTQGEEIKLKMKVHFNKDTTHPIFAWKLKSEKGQELVGTNTWYENIDFGDVKAGQTITVEFKTQLFLGAGQYLLDFGCTRFEKDTLEILQREHEITTVDVISSRRNVGFFNPMCEVSFERKDK